MARVVLGAADQGVEVNSVEGRDFDLDVSFQQSINNCIEYELAQFAVDSHWIALHEGFGIFKKRVIFSFGRRILVITFDVFAVMAGAPSAWVTP